MDVEMPKPTDESLTAFAALVPEDPRVAVKPMFGNVGAFVNGNMFMGLFGDQLGVKLSDADGARLRSDGGGPFGPSQRPMGGYVSLPEGWAERPDQAAEWVDAALGHVAAVPPKSPTKRRGG